MEGGGDNSGDENYEPPKKMKSEWSKSYSNKAFQMMRKMGYENDKGLGKLNQGRLEPVMAVQQDGRRGLGLKIDDITTIEEWDFNSETLNIPERVEWLINNNSDLNEFPFSNDDLKSWIRLDIKKETIHDETLFCDPNILHEVLDSKQVFDTLDENDMRRARSRSNPFETIRSSIFLNRAAVKMANMDAMCDYMFTRPLHKNGQTMINEEELLYFADICAGPGGFSEYILYRTGWNAKGFGFTLRGQNDFKLDKFFAGCAESFDPYYGIKDDGDIYDRDNQESFANYIHKHTLNGVHFVMADGGFSVEGQENVQEILSKQLYLCQFLTALRILRENGHFVCKLFDLFTPFSVGLIYLMYQCFVKIAIIKPNSSRPANSERYLVCKWKLPHTNLIENYLNNINDIINKQKDNNDDLDVLELVNLDIIMQDDKFYTYIINSNNNIGREQIIGLRKIAIFCRNTQLKELRQADCRKRCLELWKLPDKIRQPPDEKTIERLLEEIMGNWYDDIKLINTPATDLCTYGILEKFVKSVYDWYFVPVGRSETSINVCGLFICRSRGQLLRYTDAKKWEPVEYAFGISPKSLFFGEIVFEFSGEGRTQTRMSSLHIIDAIMLGGRDIRKRTLNERINLCKKYCESINKPYKEGNLSVRGKKLYELQQMDEFFNNMRPYMLKDGLRRLGFDLRDGKYFVPGGIMLLCKVAHNFYSLMSKSHKQLYYFDVENGQSYYMNQMPEKMLAVLWASFRNTFARRLFWKWSSTQQVELEESALNADAQNSLLYRLDFQKFIYNKLN